ncbi:hypothetical protein INR49_014650 [Caranx melampygus]|nr:hypothetical protein INR49_014650 [Caranx melampygus]
MDPLTFKSLLFLLSFIGCCAGEDILPEGPVDVVVGRNVTIKTLLTNPEYMFITWNFNHEGEQINVATLGPKGVKEGPQYVGRVSIDPTTGALNITSVKPEDSGDFSINILKEDSTTKTAEIELRVLEPVSDVVIKSNMPEAIERNSTVVLTCTAKGSFLTFSWINGTVPVVDDGKRIIIKNGELSSTLTVEDIFRSELAGPIYCSASNKIEMEKSAPFNLTVYFSNPPATFSWYHDDKPMDVSGAILPIKVIEEKGFGKKKGSYSCMAHNDKTKRTLSSVALFVIVIGHHRYHHHWSTETLIAGNSTAKISCQEKAGNVETKKWMKDGQPLIASSRVVFSPNMSSVTISPVQKEDNGEFKCQFSNPVSTDEASYKMVVNYGPESPTVVGEAFVEFDDHVELTCSAMSIPPATYSWKFNGTATEVKAAKYVIDKALYQSSGTYTCEARNAVTGKTTMHTHTLSVKEAGSSGLTDGAIAGIVIAVIVVLAAAIGLVIYCRQKGPVAVLKTTSLHTTGDLTILFPMIHQCSWEGSPVGIQLVPCEARPAFPIILLLSLSLSLSAAGADSRNLI